MTNLDMHFMFENGIRGGVATIGSPRYAKAKHEEMGEEYDPENQNSFLLYLDFNAMYSYCMKQYCLSTFGWKYLTESEIEALDIMSIPEDAHHGYLIECDISVSDEKDHSYYDALPLCPENIRISPEELSEYTKELAKKNGINLEALREIKKLCLTLKDKKYYLTHYLNLQFYHRRAAYSICESWFLIHQDVYHDLFVCS